VDFIVVDASIDGEAAQLFSIGDGDTLDLSDVQAEHGAQELTIICITDPEPFAATPFIIGSAGLRDNFNTNNDNDEFQIENNPPFTLADDNSSDYNVTPFSDFVGEEFTVTCQAFCERNLQGLSSESVSISFTIQA
jgi:hypothetical protein